MRKLILHSNLSPGDIVTMTAAVRDLHAAHPGKFLTDVRTPCPALWENNPRVTPLNDEDAEHIHLEYPLIHQSNQLPFHFIHGYRMNLAAQLGIDIPAGPFKGDIHISDEEKGWFSQVREITGTDEPFWIVVAGGKRDFTAKLWDPARWQGVVDQLLSTGKIKRIVQVGEKGHAHPALRNVIDLRGKTDLRQLVRLVYHSAGVICPVTSLMHLAAAVPTKTGGIRPCVVVAGGREPSQWEAYPGHRYLDTIGTLPCCSNGGCWKSRVSPLGDGEKHDESLCVRPVKSGNAVIPQCLQMITVNHVVEAVKSYLVTPANEKPLELAKQPAKSCCGQPSAAKVAGNAAKAAGRAIGAFLTGKPVLVETDVRNARLTVCHSCDRFDPKKNRCSECGCYVNGKTKLATERCPLGKWPGEVVTAPAVKPPIEAAVCISIHGSHRKSNGTINAADHLEMLEGAVEQLSDGGTMPVIVSVIGPWTWDHNPGDLADRLEAVKQRVTWVESPDAGHQEGALAAIYAGLAAAYELNAEWLFVAAEDTFFTAPNPVRAAIRRANEKGVDYIGNIFLDDIGIQAVSTQVFLVKVRRLYNPAENYTPFHVQFFSGAYHGLEHYMVQTLVNHGIPYLRELPAPYAHTHSADEMRIWRKQGAESAGDLLLTFEHGLGDAIQFTAVLRHLKSAHPEWKIDVASKTGKHTAFNGLCRRSYDIDREPLPTNYKQIVKIEWPEHGGNDKDTPSTKTVRCIRERMEMEVDHGLLRYSIDIQAESFAAAEAYLTGIGAKRSGGSGFNVVALHYQGNTATERKNLDHSVARAICLHILSAGFIPLILDWDRRSPLPENRTIFCPDANDPLWGATGTGDANRLAALLESCAAVVGIDSGPLHVAAATTVPTIGVWTKHLPVHYFDYSLVQHLVPDNWRDRLPIETAEFMARNYDLTTYSDSISAAVRSKLDPIFSRYGSGNH